MQPARAVYLLLLAVAMSAASAVAVAVESAQAARPENRRVCGFVRTGDGPATLCANCCARLGWLSYYYRKSIFRSSRTCVCK